VIVADTGTGNFDLGQISIEGGARPTRLVSGPANQFHGAVSPDGKWLAYTSDESGRAEVYLQRYPEAGDRVQISNRGGWEPRWRGNGGELFYISESLKMMAVPVTLGARATAGIPVELFSVKTHPTPSAYRRNYDVTRDGQRFLVVTLLDNTPPPSITVVTNWFAGLAARP
jgi:Tol biopolymer transport system component